MNAADAQRIAERYPRSRVRWWILVAFVLGGIGGAWLLWAAWYGSTQLVAARVEAFTVRSDAEIAVSVTVDRPDPSRAAQCLVFAEDPDHDRVAELPVRVAAGGQRLTTLQLSLRTISRATTADVEACRTIG